MATSLRERSPSDSCESELLVVLRLHSLMFRRFPKMIPEFTFNYTNSYACQPPRCLTWNYTLFISYKGHWRHFGVCTLYPAVLWDYWVENSREEWFATSKLVFYHLQIYQVQKKLPTSQADEFYSNKMKTVIKDNNYGKVIAADPYT